MYIICSPRCWKHDLNSKGPPVYEGSPHYLLQQASAGDLYNVRNIKIIIHVHVDKKDYLRASMVLCKLLKEKIYSVQEQVCQIYNDN